uniref:Putative leucine-rich repeat protein n=1 Tax=Anopheles braziliensis TaxID=58242 RepID=A0A2M3YY84_9DIPT
MKMLLPTTKCNTMWLVLCVILLPALLQAAEAATYECKNEKHRDENYCVFRNVVYDGRNAIEFKAPSSRELQVAFLDSKLKHIPKELLTAFPEMRVLDVVNCNLTSVVIPNKLERLFASDNIISKVIVHQSPATTTMTELMLDSNRLLDISNITQHLKKLEILNLNGNEELAKAKAIDLGMFAGMANLRSLTLAGIGAYYVDNDREVKFPELELLDLSNNDLITTNLAVKVFATMPKLETLRLAHNKITSLDVIELTQNNKLKEIYLEGNDFPCNYQTLLVKHLMESGVELGVQGKNVECMQGYMKQNDMCCRTSLLDNIPFTTPLSKENSNDGALTNQEANGESTPTTTIKTTVRMTTVGTTSMRTSTTHAPSAGVAKGNERDDASSDASILILGNSLTSCLMLAIAKLILF